MDSNIIWGLIALILFIYGIKTIKDREFALGIGRPPIFYVTLKDGFALVVGAALLICGVINILIILITSTRMDSSSEWLNVTGASLFILGYVFVICLILQYAVYLGEWLRKPIGDEDKAKR
jgi:hypothetical protein